MVMKYRVFWQVPNAGPAMSTFHLEGQAPAAAPQPIADAFHTFFDAIKTYLPDEVGVSFDNEVTDHVTASGQLVGSFPVTPPTTVAGSGVSTWAGGAGGRLVWSTGRIINGRRVRGSTFLVPFTSSAFASSGRLNSAAIALVNGSASTLRTSLNSNGSPLCVWSAPVSGRPGTTSIVDGHGLDEVAGTLRSRKY